MTTFHISDWGRAVCKWETYGESYGDEVLEVGPFFCGCCSHRCLCSASAAKEALIEKCIERIKR